MNFPVLLLSKIAELLNCKYQGLLSFICSYIDFLNVDSLSKSEAEIWGSLPSQKVSIGIKFSAMSFPNKDTILLKIYFCVEVNPILK